MQRCTNAGIWIDCSEIISIGAVIGMSVVYASIGPEPCIFDCRIVPLLMPCLFHPFLKCSAYSSYFFPRERRLNSSISFGALMDSDNDVQTANVVAPLPPNDTGIIEFAEPPR